MRSARMVGLAGYRTRYTASVWKGGDGSIVQVPSTRASAKHAKAPAPPIYRLYSATMGGKNKGPAPPP